VIEDFSQINISPDTILCSFDIKNMKTSRDGHEQGIMGNGSIIIPPHD
jgi:hypothetical protein